ncbi:MAG: glycosyltransferase family 2 protein [Armatimonadota bacterium]
MSGISAVITTCNEVEHIEECLKSVLWVDEIVIIDLESTDGTVDMCRKYTDRILSHPRVPVVELVRNYGIEQACGEWVLVLDPDERVTEELAGTLKELSEKGGADVYGIRKIDWMFGRPILHGGWSAAWHIRFFRKGCVEWPAEVHAVPIPRGVLKNVDPQAGYIEHHNYRDISHFIEKLNRYTSMEAKRLYDRGRPFHWLKLFYQPTKQFYTQYIKNRGYKDGLVGLMLAFLMTFYTQVSYMKLWELYDHERRKRPS